MLTRDEVGRAAVKSLLFAMLVVGLAALVDVAFGAPAPLPAVEVNRLCFPGEWCFGDGPTPIPRPIPGPVPDPEFLSGGDTMRVLAQTATWWTYTGQRLTWHDCDGPMVRKLEGAPLETASFLLDLKRDHSASVITALNPWKAQLSEAITMENRRRLAGGRDLVPIDSVNALWQDFVTVHAEEIAAAFQPTSAIPGCTPPGTTGRCDCVPCGEGNVCDCLLFIEGDDDCSVVVRENCNIEFSPDPKPAGAHSLDINWGR